jgi:hypothetical protein
MRCKVRRLLQRVAAFYSLENSDVDDQAEVWAAGEEAAGYADEKVANRDAKVWHGATGNGP